jgi:hypothetical protein
VRVDEIAFFMETDQLAFIASRDDTASIDPELTESLHRAAKLLQMDSNVLQDILTFSHLDAKKRLKADEASKWRNRLCQVRSCFNSV